MRAAPRFAIAQSNLLSRNFKDAAAQMAALENDPQLREQALLFEAEAFKAAGKTADAIRTLESWLDRKFALPTQCAARRCWPSFTLRRRRHQSAAHPRGDPSKDCPGRTTSSSSTPSRLSWATSFAKSSNSRKRSRVTATLIRANRSLGCKTTGSPEWSAGLRRTSPPSAPNRPDHPARAAPTTSSRESIANAQKLRTDFENCPRSPRQSTCALAAVFTSSIAKWEAAVVNQEILDRFKDSPEREPALFGLIVALADVNQPQRTEERCEQYLRDFQNGPNAATVGYLLGAVALQAGDPKAAEAYFSRILETQPKSQFREQIRYLLGNAKFMAGSYEEAVTAYKNI